MFHIDSPHLRNPAMDLTGNKTVEQVYINRYESLIIEQIQRHHCNTSGCFYCYSEVEPKVPIDTRDIIEANCSGMLVCNYCEVPKELYSTIYPEDFIIVRQEECMEIAQVKLVGKIVGLKRHSLGIFGEPLPEVVRKVTTEDLEKVRNNFQDEERALPIFKQALSKCNLNMKLVSIHYQFDRKKLFFFYTADGRVDFRELAKDLASEFRTRIELRQIGVRDEAKKVGGVGTCGREYCCILFLSSFKRITTQLANEQNLLSSMGKLSGPCGKLKCCLSFEV